MTSKSEQRRLAIQKEGRMRDLAKMDALVAEKVFGWKLGTGPWLGDIERPDGYMTTKSDVPPYSTDIALAVSVLASLMYENPESDFWDIKRRPYGKQYEIGLKYGSIPYKIGQYDCPLPEAIVRHVLHVLGVEIK